jgi:hypothetical protein
MTCKNCDIHRGHLKLFLGLVYYGTPWFLRIRLRWRFPCVYVQHMPGCGCWVLAKDAWQYVKLIWPHLWKGYEAKRKAALRTRELMVFRTRHIRPVPQAKAASSDA